MAASLQESHRKYDTNKSDKVKVTFLASEWGSSKGDLSTISRHLAIELAKSSDVEISFFVPQCSEESKTEALRHNIIIVEATQMVGYEELDWLSFPPDDLQIEVVVGYGVKLGRQVQAIRRSHQCKWVQVVHTDPEEMGMFECYPDSICRGEEKRKDEVKLCEKADFVVGIGPKLAEIFRSYLRYCKNDEIIFDFTPGIFEEFLTVKQAPEERNHRSVLVFGCGDVEDFKLKGFDIAGKAIASLADTRLVFVGAPKEKYGEVKESFMQCGVPANRLRVRGYDKSRESLKLLFCEVDLVLMPSRTDGFELTGVEALSAGLPVLASKNSGFGEALYKVPLCSAFVIDSDIPDIWTAAIKNIVWDKDRQCRLKEAENVRILYGKEYSWTKQSDALRSKIIKLARASLQIQIDGVPIAEGSGQKGTGTEVHSREPQEVSHGVDTVLTTENCGNESDQTREAVLDEIVRYLRNVNPEELNNFIHILQEVLKLKILQLRRDSIIITVEVCSEEILEELWQDYQKGHLNEMAQKFLVTEQLLEKFGLIEFKLTTFIAEEEYKACQRYFSAPLFKEAALAQGSVSGEEEEEEGNQTLSEEEDEEIEVSSEKSEEDEEVDLTSDEEIEVSSQDDVSFQDENEFSRPFRDTNEDSIVICSGEVVKEGTRWDPKQVAVHVIFPSGAVSEDRILKLVRWNPRARAPRQEDIVSDVIELSAVDSPGILHFNEAVTIVIPHCASDLKGYEVVIKTLINSETNEWDDIFETEDLRTKHDIKGDHAGSGDVPDFLFPVAISKITQCSTFVVVCRLRSHEHTITSQESELVWPEFPLARISFPQNAVPRVESFEVIVKLQEVSQKLFKKREILPGPILRITSPRAVEFLKPVTIQLPLSLGKRYRRRDIDMSIVRVRVLFKESSAEEQEWIEITDKLKTPPRFDGNIITFEVRHFSVCSLWTLVDWCWNKLPLGGGAGAVIDQAVEPEVKKLDSVPKAASFLVFVPRDTRLHYPSELRLYCSPTCKKPEVEESESKKDNVMIGDGSSDEPMYFNNKAFMFLSDPENVVAARFPERLRKFHVSLQDEPLLKSLKIRVENRGDLIVSFFKSQERHEDDMLCELEVTLPPQKADPAKTPVEFFGLPFCDTTFDDIPFDDAYGILTVCRGVLSEIKRKQIYDDHLSMKKVSLLSEVKQSFLMELSKLPQEHKERCFDKIVSGLEAGGDGLKHIRDRLHRARAKINEQISCRICDVVAEKMQKGTSWITLARDLEPKIPESDIDELQENEVSPKECCRIALRKWYQRFTFQATSQELMRCLTNMGFANLNWHIMKELGLVLYEDIPESER